MTSILRDAYDVSMDPVHPSSASSIHHAPPTILLTCGDPAGIGPEIVIGAWRATEAHARARLRVVADAATLARVLADRGGVSPLPCTLIAADDPRPSRADRLLVVEPEPGSPAETIPAGRITAAGGATAARAVMAAVRIIQQGLGHALVTGPLHKEALHAAGYDVPGHTELLARACGRADDAASMMLWLPRETGAGGLGVVHATLHESLRTALKRLSAARIVQAGTQIGPVLTALLHRAPRIAVAALNPHGGEGGLFGDDERHLVEPAVRELRASGLDVTGPLPADTLFARAAGGEFDGVVALYHDQGHIPIKLLGMHRAVNITLGLPLVRTSVAHGTGFDIVGTGRADPRSLLAAIDAALQLVEADYGRSAPSPCT